MLEVSIDAYRQALPPEGRTELFKSVVAQMPEHLRAGGPPFVEAVVVPEDAPAIDRLVAYTGRRP
ncbi:MAG: hypothetical protein ACRDX8_01470 [Acidimicrobiales bacterium]